MGWPAVLSGLICWTVAGRREAKLKEHAMRTSQKITGIVTTIGIDIGKNTFHLVGFDQRGAIILQQKVSRGQLERRVANIPRCLIGMEACSGSHHIGRQLAEIGHDVRLIPAQYVKPFLKGHKNDYRDAEAIAEAVQRPTMHFVTIKTPEQMDLLALHRVRSRLVGRRTGVINQIRGFLIERGITVRQGPMPLRKALPEILSSDTGALSPRMVGLIADLAQDWRRLDERIAAVSTEIEALAEQDDSCQRLMTVPGVGPIISSAVVAAIGNGTGIQAGPRLWRLAGARAEAGVDGGSHNPGQDLQARQQVPENTVRAGRARRSRAAAERSDAGFVALGRASFKNGWTATCWRSRSPTSSPASPGRFARAVAPINRGSPMQHDKGSLRFTKEMPAPLSATITRQLGRASDGGSEGMASRDPADVKHQNGDQVV
jgi:transposase